MTDALVITPDFPPAIGGIQTLLHSVVSRWTRIRPFVVTLAQDGAREFDAQQELSIARVPLAAGLPRRTALASLNAAALVQGLRRRPAVVLSGHVVSSPAAAALARALGIPVAQYVYGRELATMEGLARFAVRRASAVVAISGYTEGLAVSRGASPERVHRIAPGIPERRRPLLRDEPLPEIVVVSRLADRDKGHDMLLRALPLVRREVPEARLVVVGDGPLRAEYEALAAQHGVADAVTFTGAVSDDARDAQLARASVFAMPARADGGGEGFGIVYLEAAAAGLPVVAGDAGGARDAVVDGETGIVVDPHDHRALAAALVRLLADRELARRLGRAGARRAASFSEAKTARRVEDVLVGLAER